MHRRAACPRLTADDGRACSRPLEIAAIDLPGALEAINIPVLLAVAGQVVSPQGQRTAAARLHRATLAEIDGSRHEILKERDEFRDRFWAAFDRWPAIQGSTAAPPP